MNSVLSVFGMLDQRLALECRALFLRGFELNVSIGIHDFERRQPQRLLIDVDLCVPLAASPAQIDDIAQTLDYDFVRHTAVELTQGRHFEIQETLCDALLRAFLARDEVHAARVATYKPDVYPDSRAVGVERLGMKP